MLGWVSSRGARPSTTLGSVPVSQIKPACQCVRPAHETVRWHCCLERPRPTQFDHPRDWKPTNCCHSRPHHVGVLSGWCRHRYHGVEVCLHGHVDVHSPHEVVEVRPVCCWHLTIVRCLHHTPQTPCRFHGQRGECVRFVNHLCRRGCPITCQRIECAGASVGHVSCVQFAKPTPPKTQPKPRWLSTAQALLCAKPANVSYGTKWRACASGARLEF